MDEDELRQRITKILMRLENVATLAFAPSRPLSQAVADLQRAFAEGRVQVDDPRLRNVVWMKQHPDFWAL